MLAHQLEILDQIKQSAKEITPIGSEILLFGSRARGTAREDSD
ncbi:MAG: nucleotidyltransferase domain-containing protein [Clostridia bacterium]|nr:nucleotidyltransferase domain-containing protein [Clostridia bacterium]